MYGSRNGHSPQVILVVDDHPAMRETLADVLSLFGYQVLCAQDGLQALELLSTHPVDAVLSDVRMPRMDGLKLARRVREMAQPPAFFLVTAHGDPEALEEARDEGTVVFGKPLDIPAFLAALRDRVPART